MKTKSFALFWAFCSLFLILGTTAVYYTWYQPSPDSNQTTMPSTVYFEVGEFDAVAGGGRLVRATVVLEVGNQKTLQKISADVPSIKNMILRSFHGFTGSRLSTGLGKIDLQNHICNSLNDRYGPNTISEVLFTNFYMSLN